MSDLREFASALQNVLGHVGDVSLTALALALCFQFVKLAATARAWQGILRASYPESRVPFSGTFGAYLTAVGLNAVLPARSGEVARVALAKRMIPGATYPAVAATILVETLIDAVLLAPVVLAALGLGLLSAGVVPWSSVLPAVAGHPGLLAAGLTAFALVAALLLRAGIRRKAWLHGVVVEARRGLSVFGARRVELGRIAGWQIVALAARAGAVWWFLHAFHLPSTPRVVFAVIAVQALASLIPLLPGGAGAQQAMLLVALGGLIPASALLGFSVGTQATVAAFDVALGLIALALLLRTLHVRRSLRALRAERPASPPAVSPLDP